MCSEILSSPHGSLGYCFDNYPLPLTEQRSFLTLCPLSVLMKETTAGPPCAPRA